MTTTYSPTRKTLHWLMALLIITAFPLGMIANNAPFATGEEIASKAWLFSMHKTVGVTIFFTALIRILWALMQKSPPDLHPERRLETFAAHMVHWLLYISILMVPLTGWIHHAASAGFAPIWWPFGQSLPMVPKSESVANFFSAGHFVFTKLLLASVVLHVAGALKHVFIDRDQTLRRMLPGKVDAPAPSGQSHSKKPMLAAMVIYAFAIGLGTWIAMENDHDHDHGAVLTETHEDAQVETHGHDEPDTHENDQPDAHGHDDSQDAVGNGSWAVTDGTLGLSIHQFGSDVSGTFSNWSARINFDPKTGSGSTDVSINIASLSLGSLSAQAMGADFFDSQNHPTARFTAQIEPDGKTYIANGSLTIKGRQHPVSLPFSLSIDGNTAHMNGQLTLQRLDYGIGSNMTDEASLKFPVAVTINLTASRIP